MTTNELYYIVRTWHGDADGYDTQQFPYESDARGWAKAQREQGHRVELYEARPLDIEVLEGDQSRPMSEEEKAEFAREMSEIDHYNAVADANHFRSRWSIPGVADFSAPHPYTNKWFLLYDGHWGERAVTVTIEGSTWLDLWRAADTAITESGDEHHVFIEDFDENTDDTLTLTTGS